ncbi:MAG: glucan 1,4-alpha-glucosidase [Gemmatimonadaceae bacterium]
MAYDPPPQSAEAAGWPGHDPRWTSSAKSGIGTALSAQSRVWFTISHGIVNEVYYPRVDLANIRDLGLIVTDGVAFFSEEKRHTTSVVVQLAPGVPGYRLTNTCVDGRYRIVKTIITDPLRDVLLQDIRFEPLVGELADYRLFALLAPHIGNQGRGNDGWTGGYKGVPMLFAQRGGCALALASSAGYAAVSCGYVGSSDGWQDLAANKRLTQRHTEARNGNIALTGEVDLTACGGHFVLALAFGRDDTEAGQDARGALLEDFDDVAAAFHRGWVDYQRSCAVLGTHGDRDSAENARSIAVLKTQEDKGHPGGIIASLSIPWGSHKGDHDMGGYHLVWPRDLVECAGGLLAAGDSESARRTLSFLMCTQEADGHWAQNMWLDGTPYWTGIQMDETGLPILLADLLRRTSALGTVRPWPMVRLAASYLLRNGPVTPQDRWEEESGNSPFTLAVEIAALLAAADFADDAGEARVATYLRDAADDWNDHIEKWTYVTNSPLANRIGVAGYYARIGPPDVADAGSPASGFVPIKNRPVGTSRGGYEALVSPDALALVRFGLRAPDDQRIVNTIAVIDAELKRETRTGPVWHRYNGDVYGEHDDGSPFDGTGTGRGWPLLAGERAHYEIAAGRLDIARRLQDVMRAQTSPGGLIPEQIWDAPDLAAKGLLNGGPSGSAMPLAWAHAEYVKLSRSLQDATVFDMPPQTVQRYLRERRTSDYAIWYFNNKPRSMAGGQTLRLSLRVPALVHWSGDGWQSTHDVAGSDSGLGVWYADLATGALPAGSVVHFTVFWLGAQRWEGSDFAVNVVAR